MKVTIVRHGETDSNVKRIIQGSTDTPLNTNGLRQADQVGDRLKDEHYDAVFCSDLQRCRQTLNGFLRHRPDLSDSVAYTPSLREKDLGDLEGLTLAEAQKLITSRNHTMNDYGEGQPAFSHRLLKFWGDHIEPLRPTAISVLIVTHGGAIATLLTELELQRHFTYAQGVKYGGVPRNTGVSVVECPKGSLRGVVEVYGDISHVKQEMKETVVGVDAAVGQAAKKAEEERGIITGFALGFRAAA
ncbi:phosphoglycerate mutase-like protein [Saitoella complicata NRRL Y-17804]|uniref:Uncharacterized protein n=1 Tax=Saitoella complicata (strain BCRC 22490 / CBS 7301 / JCM 7358 / NBRC 10748 / NRRL Y-17804) TaxID=698492 RepID=A0A0E9NG44_SAICN|nr:phosphoglycerate mutase-like protein [Saitoella complicata NRRL Y-17804]ODQ51949.1 phosphoglycerate mutase-like protein [Saitoella complicata NRRL Y-17804]GAO48661.1 hypothetical protein G7K_2831-t1 [Saitoella complicata NRRL Y-17804]